MVYRSLCQEKALIWRIIHRSNLPWVLDNGLHCGNSPLRAPGWVNIGNSELINRRSTHFVPIEPGGNLNDYVPFYFTPFSPMLRNIHTGWGGIAQRSNEEIVILVSSLPHLHALGCRFIFTDSHAYYQWANFYSNLTDLDKIDWPILQKRDFKRDAEDPAKFERYQAEALIHQAVPVEGLLGVICYTDTVRVALEEASQQRNLALPIYARKDWYF